MITCDETRRWTRIEDYGEERNGKNGEKKENLDSENDP